MKDTDKFPFGKYKGKAIQDVPASYLNWLWHNWKGESLSNDNQRDVRDYIERNLDALKIEKPDLIW